MSETVDQRTVWDAARVTDPVPPDYEGPPCMLPEVHVLPGHLPLRCSRQRGHAPGTQHVATDWYGVLAVWPGETT